MKLIASGVANCAATTFDALAPGDEVNLEADVLAKYVEKLLHS